MRAHASQIGETSFFLSMPDDVFSMVWGASGTSGSDPPGVLLPTAHASRDSTPTRRGPVVTATHRSYGSTGPPGDDRPAARGSDG